MSNLLHFTGRLATAPTLTRHGETTVCRFRLLRDEYQGKNARDKRLVSIDFTAFGARAEFVSKNFLRGDQAIVVARVVNNNYTDGQDVERYSYNFIVDQIDFGAPGSEKRKQLAEQGSRAGNAHEGSTHFEDEPIPF